MFYVYEWYIIDTNEIIYVGKGCRNRMKVKKHNRLFNDMIKRYKCASRIVKQFENETDAFCYEYQRINELRQQDQCVCNIHNGGYGGVVDWWTEERREQYSKFNIMKTERQRKRMSEENPMKNKAIANKVGITKRRAVVIDGKHYDSVFIAANMCGVTVNTIIKWCKRGYDTNHNPCRYANEEQKKYSVKSSSKAVIIDGERFNSVKEGAQFLGVWSETLIRAIKHNRKCKNHSCRYDNQQPSQEKSDNSILEGSTTNG